MGKDHYIKKFGEIKDFEVKCSSCGKLFFVKEREKRFPQREVYYCSRSCANRRIRTDEIKNKISISVRKNYNSSERKRQRDLFKVANICNNCNCLFLTNKRWVIRLFCSRECRTYFERKDNGDKENYCRASGFRFNLHDFPEEFELKLIDKYGWYKAKNRGDNSKGVSRDHIYSVSEGFKNNIDPKIISHPANCQLMRQNENSSKYSKCDIKIEDLIKKIKKWDKKYNGKILNDGIGVSLQN